MRTVPESFYKAAFARETDSAFIAVLTLDHPALASPIRVSTDSIDTHSRGVDFIAYPVEVFLPADEDGRPRSARLRIDNLDRDISAALASISTPPSVLIEMVLSTAPDEVVTTFSHFKLQRCDYDAMVIEAELTVKHYGQEPYPTLIYGPNRFPNMFRS